MQLDRLGQGEAQGLAVGIGMAAGRWRRPTAATIACGVNVGLAVEGDGQHAAGGGGA